MPLILFYISLFLSALPIQAEDYENLPYNRLQQKSVHNAYQRQETLTEQLEVYGLRSLELDIFPSKKGKMAPATDWYVYHSPSDPKSSVSSLSDALQLLKSFHDKNPGHEMITVWMDIKADFENEGHRPEDLDRRFQQSLGSILWSPSDLKDRCPEALTLQDAVRASGCDWPSLHELRGRVMIVLTSAPILSYVDYGRASLQRAAFIAPEITSIEASTRFPDTVFFNMQKSVALNGQVLQGLHARRLIGRTWGVNDARAWKILVALPIHHIATDKVNTQKDPWATTWDSEGHVFGVIF